MRNNADAEWLSHSCNRREHPVKEAKTEKMIKLKNPFSVKPKLQTVRWALLLLLLLAGSVGAWAQGPYPNQGNQQVCITGIPEPYGVITAAGSTYAWTVDGLLISPNWTLISNGTHLTTITWRNPGIYRVQVVETITATGCPGAQVFIDVTVNP